jgi:hypothetical protein
MGCLFVMFAGVFPRMALLFVWIARPTMVDAAFDTFIWPLLGLFFLPFATLMYVILWQVGGLEGSDWIWVALAAALDIGHWGAGYTQRRDAPGYPSSTRV